jgi:lipopolysaccharide exporter
MDDDKNVSSRVVKGVAWMLMLRIALRLLGLLSTMVLARLLTPEDFGIVAIAMSFFALLTLFKSFGFDTAIIQIKHPEREHYDTAWTFNFIFGMCFAVILALCAGWIAEFYDNEELHSLVMAVSLLFVIGSVKNVGTLDFRKNLTFSKEFSLHIIPKIVGIPVTLYLAYVYRNYWALTIGTLVTTLASIVVGYVMHTYRPRLSLKYAKELFNFSKWLMANNFIYFINNRSPEMIVGKLLNPQAAGFLSVASETAMVTTTEFAAAVSRASYPGYAKLKDNLHDLKNLYLNVVSSVAFLVFPLGVGVALTSELLVPLFLGDQWLEIIPLIRNIAISGIFFSINSNAGYVLMALGKPRLSTMIGFIRVLIFIPVLVVCVYFQGLYGAAMAMLYVSVIMFFVNSFVAILHLPVTVSDFVKTYLRPFVCSLCMCLAVLSSTEIHSSGEALMDVYRVLLIVMVAVPAYFSSVYLIWFLSGRPAGPEFKLHEYICLYCSKWMPRTGNG